MLVVEILLIGLTLFSCKNSNSADNDDYGALSALSEKLENSLLKNLEQAKQGAKINAFSSDGCSGGLSSGWESLAATFPAFKQRFGKQPPWHQCCLTHDRLYWVGVTKNGYKERKHADAELRRCVQTKGAELAPELAQKYQLQEEEIKRGFTLASKLMYSAVRLGGRPCSGLPWRWGYGWPQCSPLPGI